MRKIGFLHLKPQYLCAHKLGTLSSVKCRGSRDFSTNKQTRAIFEEYAIQNNMSPADWYFIQSKNLDEKTLNILSEEFGGSLYRALSTLFSETEWLPWKFKSDSPHRVPRGFWKEQSNQRKFFEDLGKQIGIQTLDDWYQQLSAKLILDHGGRTLLEHYKDSPLAALQASYPEHNWILWKFNVPIGFWKSIENQRKYLDWLGKELGINSLDDWYSKSAKTLQDNNGGSLLNHYSGSLASALVTVYPEHNWIPWKFNSVPQGFWNSAENQKKYFDWLGNQIGIKQLDDWYEVLSVKLLQKNGGSRILHHHNASPASALMAAYPEHKWAPWKFTKIPLQTWKSKDNINAFLSELSEKLSIQTLDDWYRVDMVQLKQFGALNALLKSQGLYNILKEQYPHHPWDPKKFNQVGKKGQRWLAVTLKKMFPNEEIVEDYQHPKAAFSSSKRPMQLDVFIPSRSLAFEYQGKQHYEDLGFFSPSKTYQQRDEEKRNLCAANNIKLIEVPYWWNRTQESLQEIINKA